MCGYASCPGDTEGRDVDRELLLTQRGHSVAVMLDVTAFERTLDEVRTLA